MLQSHLAEEELKARGEFPQEHMVEEVPQLGIVSSSYNYLILPSYQAPNPGEVQPVQGNLDVNSKAVIQSVIWHQRI